MKKLIKIPKADHPVTPEKKKQEELPRQEHTLDLIKKNIGKKETSAGEATAKGSDKKKKSVVVV